MRKQRSLDSKEEPTGKDFLDELIEERTKVDSRFPDLVEQAISRRNMGRALTRRRQERRLTRRKVAALMRTSVSVVSELEEAGDARLSMLMRYCAAIGVNRTPSLRVKARATSPTHPRRRTPRRTKRPSAKTLNARLAKLAAAGDITLPTRKGFARIRPIRTRGKSAASTILDDRE